MLLVATGKHFNTEDLREMTLVHAVVEKMIARLNKPTQTGIFIIVLS